MAESFSIEYRVVGIECWIFVNYLHFMGEFQISIEIYQLLSAITF